MANKNPKHPDPKMQIGWGQANVKDNFEMIQMSFKNGTLQKKQLEFFEKIMKNHEMYNNDFKEIDPPVLPVGNHTVKNNFEIIKFMFKKQMLFQQQINFILETLEMNKFIELDLNKDDEDIGPQWKNIEDEKIAYHKSRPQIPMDKLYEKD